jgi:hypothetical protein
MGCRQAAPGVQSNQANLNRLAFLFSGAFFGLIPGASRDHLGVIAGSSLDVAQTELSRLRRSACHWTITLPIMVITKTVRGQRMAKRMANRETSMDAHTNTMLIIVVTGVALMLVGFGLRDRNLGMGLMGVGLITALGTILYKAYITFY